MGIFMTCDIYSGISEGPARPMTGIRGAGYPGTAQGARPGVAMFDPMNQARQAATSAGLERALEETPEDKIKAMERKVTDLIEESCLAASRGENRTALDRAKEASAKVCLISNVVQRSEKFKYFRSVP